MNPQRTIPFLIQAGIALCVAMTVHLACMPGQVVELGPIAISVPVRGGTIDAGSLGLPPGVPATIGTEVPACTILTLAEITVALLDTLGDFATPSFELTEVLLTGATLRAADGDFNSLTEVTVTYLPSPADGEEQEPILISHILSDSGFGTEIELIPLVEMDILDLLSRDDPDPAAPCPSILIELAGTVPREAIRLEILLYFDVSGIAQF